MRAPTERRAKHEPFGEPGAMEGGTVGVGRDLAAACGGLNSGEPILPGDAGHEASSGGVGSGGAEGRGPGEVAECTRTDAGACVVNLGTEHRGPGTGVAVDGTSVYWTGSDTVLKVP